MKLGEGTVLIAARGAARPAPLGGLRLHGLRPQLRPAEPAALQLQQPAGDVPRLRRPGRPPRFDPDLLVPDPTLSVWEGAIEPIGPVKEIGQVAAAHLRGRGRQPGGRPRRPAQGDDAQGALGASSSPRWRNAWLYGTGDRIIVHRGRTGARTGRTARPGKGSSPSCWPSSRSRHGGPPARQLEQYMRSMTCPDCDGGAAQPARPGRPRRRQDARRARQPCRSAGSRGSSTPWPIRPPRPGRGRGSRPARPALADDRRRRCSRKSAAGSASCSTSAWTT